MPPRKRNEPNHYWNTLEVVAVQGAANAFIEQAVNTGVAVGQKRIMLIKKIICSYGLDLNATRAPGVVSTAFVNLHTQQGEATIPALQDSGTIYFHALVNGAGGDGATAAESPSGIHHENGFPTYVEFDDPVPVADDQLSLYFDTDGFLTLQTCVLKIFYAIASVTLEEALTILESYR